LSQSESIIGLGARTDYLAQVPNADPTRLRLTAEEAALFAQVGRAARIDVLITGAGMPEPRAIALLLALRAKGAVVPARVTRPAGGGSVDAAESEEVDLPAERKKEILDLERGLDRLNHFEVLGLMAGASAEEVKQAYYAASRRYHPDRYFGKNIGSFRGRVDRIFKRVSDAYHTLSDDQKRAAYLKQHPELGGTATPAPAPPGSVPQALDPERAAERRIRMARHPYLARTTRLSELIHRSKEQIAKGQPGIALTDLHLAAQLEPQNKEVQFLQAEARRKNDLLRAQSELQKAVEAEQMGNATQACTHYKNASTFDVGSFQAAFKAAQWMRQLRQDPREQRTLAQRAVELEPKNLEARLLLAAVLVEADLKKLARKQLEEAAAHHPDHPELRKQLKKMRWPF
jgi:tetratricopeptide (TPR) repeat protein